MPWISVAQNEFNEVRKVFFSGPNGQEITREDAQSKADICLRNWRHSPVIYTEQKEPINRRPLPASAHQYGIMKSLNRLRRR